MKLKKTTNIISLFTIILLFIIIIAVTYMYPLYPDDYNYAFVFGTNVRVDSFKDILESSHIFYLDWGGRILPFVLGQLMILWGRGVFSVINGLIFIALVALIFIICLKNKGDKIEFSKLLLVAIVVIVGVPVFSETVFWQIGSINYSWMMVLTLLYIYPYFFCFLEKGEIKDGFKNYILISIVAFLAGMTNENVVPFVVFATVVYIIYMKVINKKIQKWSIFGLFFYSVGCCILMLSPGNANRAAVEYSAYNISKDFSVRIRDTFWPSFKSVIGDQYKFVLLIFIVVVIAYLFRNGYKNKEFILSMLLAMAALGTNIIMIFPSTYNLRAGFGGAIFIILAIFLLISKINISQKEIFYTVIPFITLLIIPRIFFSTIKSSIDYNEKYTNLVQYVVEEKEKGNFDIIVEPVHINQTRLFDGMELTSDKNNIQNIYFSKYYRINSIVAK